MCTAPTCTPNTGPAPSSDQRATVLAPTAVTTGMKLRGRHSNSSSSTASSTEASGALNVAAIPLAAPATSSVLRSSALVCRNCASTEPTAPPVMIIGPSAPNGPPLPMLIAAEIGFSSATRGWMRLPRERIASIASGIPCPRIRSEPKRAIKPTTSPPRAGASRISSGEWRPAPGATSDVPKRP